jgi:hypothetical protein
MRFTISLRDRIAIRDRDFQLLRSDELSVIG